MIKESFVLRVLAVLFIFLALPLLVACFIMFQRDYEQAINDARKALESTAKLRTHSIYHIKPFSSSFVGEVAAYLDLKNTMPEKTSLEMSKELEKIVEVTPDAIELSLLVPTHERGEYLQVASSNPKKMGTTFTSYDHLPSIAKGGIVEFVRTFYSPEEKKYTLYTYVAKSIVSKKDDSLLGLLLVQSNIDADVAFILEQAKDVHPADTYAVVQEDGVVVQASDPKLIGEYFRPLSNQEMKKFLEETKQDPENAKLAKNPLVINSEVGTNFFEFELANTIQLAFLPPPREFGVSVLAYSPKQKVFNQAMHRFLYIYNAYGILLILGGGISYFLSVLMARPLNQLSSLMKSVASGDLGRRFKEERLGYEINSLGMIFNQTLDSLLENIDRAENYRIAKETNQKELEIGYQVQRQLLPEKMPQGEGINLAATYLPSLVAGGDFYDCIQKDKDKYFLVVGDAAAIGISSCFYALVVRSLIKGYVSVTDDIGKILTNANAIFCTDVGDTGMYLVLLMGCYNSTTKTLSYYSCGHTAGLVRKANGHIELLDHRGMALGLDEHVKYDHADVPIEEGDLIVFYTEGLIQATNEKNQFFSRERVINCLQHRNWKTAEEVVAGLKEEVQAFTGQVPQNELTIVAMSIASKPLI